MNKLIVDGYNVIGRSAALRQAKSISLERARRELANIVLTWKQNHPSFHCLIVFDGRDSVAMNGSKITIGGVPCVFTKTKIEADDEIIRIVREEKEARSGTIVVSDDNYVGNNSRAHGATVQSAAYLDAHEKQKISGLDHKTNPSDKTMDQKTISEINREQRKRFGF